MVRKLKTFAVLGVLSIVLLILVNLQVQYSEVLVTKLFCLEGMPARWQAIGGKETIGLILACVYHFIGLLAFCLLDTAYHLIGDGTRTQNCATLGVVGSRLYIVVYLTGLARVVLLGGNGVAADPLDVMQGAFCSVGSAALGFSVLSLQVPVLKKAIPKVMCVVGAIGWFCLSCEAVARTLTSYRKVVFRFYDRYLIVFLVGIVLLVFPFIAILLTGRKSPGPAEPDTAPAEQCVGGARCRVDWPKCAAPLLVLILASIPLCVVPFLIHYRFATKNALFTSYRTNVWLFQAFCLLVGSLMSIGCLRTVIPQLRKRRLAMKGKADDDEL